jgi:hypothetical protein
MSVDPTFEVEIWRISDSFSVVLQPAYIERWCLLFSLLKYGLTEQVTITHQKKPILFVSYDPRMKSKKRIALGKVRKKEGTIFLTLAEIMMDTWLHFSLSCYQGSFPVNHIDLQFYDVDKSMNLHSFNITLGWRESSAS